MPSHAPRWSPIGWFARVSLILAALLTAIDPLNAQLPNLVDDGAGAPEKSALQVETTLTAERLEAGAVAILSVKATIPSGFHLYSMSPRFSGRTQINLVKTPGLEPLGEFTADHAPKRAHDELFDQEVEKFHGQVTWTRPMRIVDPAVAAVIANFKGTYCSAGPGGLCKRANEDLNVKLAQGTVPAASAETLPYEMAETPPANGKAPATVRVSLAPTDAAPGETVTLTVAMTLKEGWHTYSITQPEGPGARPTVLTLEKSQGLTSIGEAFIADSAPTKVPLEGSDGALILEEHFGTVVWSRQFRVDDNAYGISGAIRYLTCRESLCLQPQTIEFALGDLAEAGEVPAALPSSAGDAGSSLWSLSEADIQNLPYYLGLAFLGGFILNFMPCVLPVIAIKVMGFVQHAGQRRGHIFALNAAYAVGVISVFLMLATLTALPQVFVIASDTLGFDVLAALGFGEGPLTWGAQFQSPVFNAGMAIVVFAMGLSLLGVFEIPIPGMVGSAAGSTRQEGLMGAFLMGIFTTLLATPCTAAILTTTLGWSLKQPIVITFGIWGTMGVGMASPYLVFGLVPGAVKILPRPGNWMIHLKQFAGFVLMGTVLWLMSSLKAEYLIPLLFALLGIALGAWMFGMVQYSTKPRKRQGVSIMAVAVSLAAMFLGYEMTQESPNRLAWQPFSTEHVNELISQRKTVLIDFTADWCPNCKLNERFALNTEETKALIENHDVVPLMADFTNESEEIQQWLDRFDAVGIPLTVIFPADNPDEPIVLNGLYSQSTLIENLEQAVDGSSASSPASAPTASATPATATR